MSVLLLSLVLYCCFLLPGLGCCSLKLPGDAWYCFTVSFSWLVSSSLLLPTILSISLCCLLLLTVSFCWLMLELSGLLLLIISFSWLVLLAIAYHLSPGVGCYCYCFFLSTGAAFYYLPFHSVDLLQLLTSSQYYLPFLFVAWRCLPFLSATGVTWQCYCLSFLSADWCWLLLLTVSLCRPVSLAIAYCFFLSTGVDCNCLPFLLSPSVACYCLLLLSVNWCCLLLLYRFCLLTGVDWCCLVLLTVSFWGIVSLAIAYHFFCWLLLLTVSFCWLVLSSLL